MEFRPHSYQTRAVEWIIAHPRCALFLDMGLGKSVITLTAIRELRDYGEVSHALVVAPKKVAEATWTAEAAKWGHLSDLKVVAVTGDAKRRAKALDTPADVHVIGRDCLLWLCGRYGGFDRMPFDMLVLDELTSFKSHTSKRHRLARRMAERCARVVGLTGTPAPNGLIDLWGQMMCVDGGLSLGKSLERYRSAYFSPVKWNNVIIKCPPKRGAAEAIAGLLAPVCMRLDAGDWLELPPVTYHTARVELPPPVMRAYREFERDRVMELAASGAEVTAANAAVLMGKLAQFANGAVYDDAGGVTDIHGEKADALAELVEQAHSPVLVFHQYRHDLPKIEGRLKGYRVRRYGGPDDLTAWNAGEVDVLLAHPASTAYGLNMQDGGHYVVWYGTGWDLELYLQGNARVHRQGQRMPVHIYRLVCAGTADERALAAIEGKAGEEDALTAELRRLMEMYRV